MLFIIWINADREVHYQNGKKVECQTLAYTKFMNESKQVVNSVYVAPHMNR